MTDCCVCVSLVPSGPLFFSFCVGAEKKKKKKAIWARDYVCVCFSTAVRDVVNVYNSYLFTEYYTVKVYVCVYVSTLVLLFPSLILYSHCSSLPSCLNGDLMA